MGRDLQTKEATCYAVKTALRKQKIKVLLWETDNLFGHMDNMTPYMEQLAEFNYYHFPVLRCHNCWEIRPMQRGRIWRDIWRNAGSSSDKSESKSQNQKLNQKWNQKQNQKQNRKAKSKNKI